MKTLSFFMVWIGLTQLCHASSETCRAELMRQGLQRLLLDKDTSALLADFLDRDKTFSWLLKYKKNGGEQYDEELLKFRSRELLQKFFESFVRPMPAPKPERSQTDHKTGLGELDFSVFSDGEGLAEALEEGKDDLDRSVGILLSALGPPMDGMHASDYVVRIAMRGQMLFFAPDYYHSLYLDETTAIRTVVQVMLRSSPDLTEVLLAEIAIRSPDAFYEILGSGNVEEAGGSVAEAGGEPQTFDFSTTALTKQEKKPNSRLVRLTAALLVTASLAGSGALFYWADPPVAVAESRPKTLDELNREYLKAVEEIKQRSSAGPNKALSKVVPAPPEEPEVKPVEKTKAAEKTKPAPKPKGAVAAPAVVVAKEKQLNIRLGDSVPERAEAEIYLDGKLTPGGGNSRTFFLELAPNTPVLVRAEYKVDDEIYVAIRRLDWKDVYTLDLETVPFYRKSSLRSLEEPTP